MPSQATPVNPTDSARLGHRYQPRLLNTQTTKLQVLYRVQSVSPTIRMPQEIYHELGNVDPTGATADSPEFSVAIEEFVHDSTLDLVAAGKDPAVDTSWNAYNYIADGKLSAFILERDNSGNIAGELEYDNCVIGDATWSWRMGQPISASYTLHGRLGKRWLAGSVPHTSWAAANPTPPGGIRIKDARLFLGGSTNRMYRLQSFTLKVAYRTQVIREAGNRQTVGILMEPPDTTLDLDFAAADQQPDDLLYLAQPTGGPYTNYDYAQPLNLTSSYIRVYDPDQAEASVVLRAFVLENLITSNATPINATVRGLATKRYSLVVPKVTTGNTGGVLFYKGDAP